MTEKRWQGTKKILIKQALKRKTFDTGTALSSAFNTGSFNCMH